MFTTAKGRMTQTHTRSYVFVASWNRAGRSVKIAIGDKAWPKIIFSEQTCERKKECNFSYLTRESVLHCEKTKRKKEEKNSSKEERTSPRLFVNEIVFNFHCSAKSLRLRNFAWLWGIKRSSNDKLPWCRTTVRYFESVRRCVLSSSFGIVMTSRWEWFPGWKRWRRARENRDKTD